MTPPDRADRNGGTALAGGVARLRCAGQSDPGMVRDGNEDRYHIDPQRGLFIVVDGMGGQAGGEVAAETALETLRRHLERAGGTAEQRVREAIAEANNQVFRLAQRDPARAGMGCVLTLAVVEDGVVTVGHVGDSRLYHVSRGTLRKVTHDHSPVGVREEQGELSEREAMFHPRRNEVFRSVGGEERDPFDPEFIEIERFELGPSEAFLICSDGLTDLVPREDILKIIRRDAPDERAVVRGLVDAANRAGGKDNVTVVLVAGERFGREPGPRRAGAAAATPAIPAWRAGVGRALGRRSTFFVLGALVGIAVFAAFSLLDPDRSEFGGAAPPLSGASASHRLQVGSGRAFSTITKALTVARPGDTVFVAPGRYRERDLHLEEGVTLLGDPAGEVVIEPGIRGVVGTTGIAVDQIGSGRISGLIIVSSPATPLDVGLSIRGTDVTIDNVEIRGAIRAGVTIEGDGVATLIGNSIHDNPGVGILVSPNCRGRVLRNWIVDNGRGSPSPGPGIELGAGARVDIVGNVITGNAAEGIRAAPAGLDRSVLRTNVFAALGKQNGRGASTPTE